MASPQRGLRILPAEAALAPVLAPLHARCFDRPWDETAIARLLALPGAFGLLACGGADFQTPAGFVLGRVAGGEGEILTLCVDPAWRRAGVARALVRGAMKHAGRANAATLFLEVALSNLAAQALYGHLGFETVGRRPDYYRESDGRRDTALILRADIVPAPPDRYDARN